jgi:hypothetical protein
MGLPEKNPKIRFIDVVGMPKNGYSYDYDG